MTIAVSYVRHACADEDEFEAVKSRVFSSTLF